MREAKTEARRKLSLKLKSAPHNCDGVKGYARVEGEGVSLLVPKAEIDQKVHRAKEALRAQVAGGRWR